MDRPLKRILVSGNTTMDIVTVCRAPYNPSGKRPIAEYKQVPGGQAANVADLLARLGNAVAFMGAFGNDGAAQVVIEDFRRAGIEIGHSAFCEVPHHLGFVRVDQNTGERFIDMYRDPGLVCGNAAIDEAWLARFDCLYLDNHEPELGKRLAEAARAQSIPVVADLEEIDAHTQSIVPLVDVLIAPGKIISELAGDHVEAATRRLLKQGPMVVVATLGNEGSVGIAHGTTTAVRVPAVIVPVTDTTGAGDAFHAGFVHAMLGGHSLVSCMQIGSRIAAQKCTYSGPRIPASIASELKPSRPTEVDNRSFWQREARPVHGD